MSGKSTLRKYLLDRRVELYETIHELREKDAQYKLYDDELLKLHCAEAQLEIVKDAITICNNRKHY